MSDESPSAELPEPGEEFKGLNIALMEAATDRIWVVDRNYRLFYCNHVFQEHVKILFGRVLQRGEDVFTGAGAEPVWEEWKGYYNRVLDKGETFIVDVETRVMKPTRFIEYSLSPVYSSRKKIIAALVIGRDITEKKMIDNAISERENMYRTMFEHTWAVKLLIDPDDGHIVDANQAAARFYGYPREKMKEMYIADLNIQPPGELKRLMGKVLADGSSYFQFVHRLSDGSLRDVEVYSSIIDLHSKRILHSIIHDITDRKTAETALRLSEMQSKALLDAIPDMIFSINASGVFLNFKAALEDLYVQPEMFIGKNVREIFPEWFSSLIFEKINLVMATGSLDSFEYELAIPARGMQSYECRMIPSSADEVIAIVRNVTEKKDFLREIREMAVNARAIMEATDDVFILMYKDGVIIDCNEAHAKRLNTSRLNLIGKNVFEMLPAEVAKMRKQLIEQVYETGKAVFFEDTRGGIWNEISVYPIFVQNQRTTRVAVFARDITERKKMIALLEEKNRQLSENEEWLKAANATKDRFFSIIAHDLKSPLNGIMGLSTILKEDARNLDIDSILQYSAMIHASAQNTFNLLEDLLDWARLQQGQIPFEPEIFSVNNLIASILHELGPNAYQKGIALNSSLQEEFRLNADAKMIRTVVENLVSNAIKFTKPSGRITVSVSKTDGTTVLSVQDTGIGMSEESLSKIFNIETSFTTRGTQNEKGTGLGLLLCKEFIDKHHGSIHVESNPGVGTTFTVILPSPEIS
jgi:PAS domain S-box-containing protein